MEAIWYLAKLLKDKGVITLEEFQEIEKHYSKLQTQFKP